MSDLSIDFCGLLFKNPVIVSSIEPTKSLERLKRCAHYRQCRRRVPGFLGRYRQNGGGLRK